MTVVSLQVSDFISNTAYAANDNVNLVESLCLVCHLHVATLANISALLHTVLQA